MRICHVAYSFYESDNRVIRYAETLAARGDHVDVFALRRTGQPAQAHVNGVAVHRIQKRVRSEGAPATYLLKILLFLTRVLVILGIRSVRRKYDVIHVHNIPDFLVVAGVIPKLRGARVILDIHDVVPELYAGKFNRTRQSLLVRSLLVVERLSCRMSDHVIIANHLWYEKLTRRSVEAGKCSPIMNYPDLDIFQPDSSGLATRKGFTFLYPGTLNHHQGLDIAIDAFARVAAAMPDAELHIYGEGPTRQALERQAAATGLGSRVRLADRVPLSDVPALMRGADAGVVPKRADGFGDEAFSTKILEFMACRVPVIVSRTKVDAHYFDDELVQFFEPGSAADLAVQMRFMYENPSTRHAMAARGHQRALAYSWQRHANEYLGIVDALAEGRQPTSAHAGQD